MGFNIDMCKTQVWWWDIPTPILNFRASVSPKQEVPVLGSPIGHGRACRSIISSKLSHTSLCPMPWNYSRIRKQCITSSGAAPELAEFFISSEPPPHLTTVVSDIFDKRQRGAFEAIHRLVKLDAWDCATVPLKQGGLGLDRTTLVVKAAYVSSSMGSWSLFNSMVSEGLRVFISQGFNLSHLRLVMDTCGNFLQT